MNQTQKTFIFQFIAIICLALAVMGITENVKIQNTDDPLNIAQSISILALALLSIGLFYQNHASQMEKMRGHVIIKLLGMACIGFFIASLIYILWISQGKVITPVYMALLAIGLFFGNKVMISDLNPEELDLTKKLTQFFHSPLGQLLVVMVILVIVGVCIAFLSILLGIR
jgi:hypothetical protein